MRPTRQELDELLAAVRRGQERAAQSAQPEAALRAEVQPFLASLLHLHGARSVARDEARLFVPTSQEVHLVDAPLTTLGRADAVYNRFVIEFEPPGSLRPSVLHSATRHAVAQVQQYLRGIANESSIPLERLAGCAFDGSWIVYVTWERGDWIVARPRPVDLDSLAGLIESLESLATGRGLTAANLDEDFGQSGDTTGLVVKSLYELFRDDAVSSRGRKMFDQWRLDIGQASGQFAATDLAEWRALCSALKVPADEQANLPVLFSLQTYFALVAKLVALIILEGATRVPLVNQLKASADVVTGLRSLESGGLTATAGTANAIEAGIFSWYATERSGALWGALTRMLDVAAEYSAEIVEITPLRARDVLKDLYQRLVPRSIRHRLGEYYTPDWLAQRLVNQVTADGTTIDPRRRVLDPACGSGTFLVEVISRMLAHRPEEAPDVTLSRITQNVIGFDLSPLAVQAAKVNYLLAVAPLIRFAAQPVFVPVFLADSVSPPRRGNLLDGNVFVLETSEGSWRVPTQLAEANSLPVVGRVLHEAVEQRRPREWVASELPNRLPMLPADDGAAVGAVAALYDKLLELERSDRDGMWWNLVSNAFAPALHGRFDYVVGNPPWVSWETLPEGYRRANDDLWLHYGLRPESPHDRRQASANVRLDLSMLFVAECVDRYLAPGGRLGFLITSTVFRSELAGRGFRRRRLPPDGTYRFVHIDDMSSLAVFEGATNQTSVLVVAKSNPQDRTQVQVARWVGTSTSRIPTSSTLEEAIRLTARRRLVAEPIDPNDAASPLLMMPRTALEASRPLRRWSPYADLIREGINTRGANGIFFVEIVEADSKLARIRNLPDEGRNEKVKAKAGLVETPLVRRLLRGSDVARGAASPSTGVLLFHDGDHVSNSIPPAEVQRRFPRGYEYIGQFRDVLQARRRFRNFDPTGDGWLGIYSVTTAALSRHKVVVREIAQGMVAAAIHSADVIPDHKLYVIPCRTALEADLLAQVLNSPVIDYMIRSFAISTSISGSFLRYLGIRDLSDMAPPRSEERFIAAAVGLTLDQFRTLDAIARRELGALRAETSVPDPGGTQELDDS